MVLLWDQWQVYNGHKATFFSGTVKTAATVNPTLPASTVPTAAPVINSTVSASQPALATAPLASVPNLPATAHELLVVTTDVLKLTFDTDGGSLVRAELLKHVNVADKTKNVVLLD